MPFFPWRNADQSFSSVIFLAGIMSRSPAKITIIFRRSLLDITWLEVEQGFLHLSGPCHSIDGRAKLNWFVRETRKGHQCSCSHPQKLRACCRATEGRLLIYCRLRWILSFEFSFRPLILLTGIFVSKLWSSLVVHWYDSKCILANGNRSGSWTNILTLAKWRHQPNCSDHVCFSPSITK